MNTRDVVMKYLRAHHIGVVSTVDRQGHPNMATVYYWMDDDFFFYFLTRRSTRKFSNIRRGSHAAFLVGTKQEARCVQVEGRASWVRNGERRLAIMRAMAKRKKLMDLYKYTESERNPFQRFPGHDLALIVLKPDWLRYMDLDKGTGRIRFTQIVPTPLTEVGA